MSRAFYFLLLFIIVFGFPASARSPLPLSHRWEKVGIPPTTRLAASGLLVLLVNSRDFLFRNGVRRPR